MTFDRWDYEERIFASGLTPKARLVGMVLARRARRETGRCWPSVASLASDTGLAARTVYRALSELARAGFLTSYGRYGREGRGVNLYQLRVPPLCACCGQPACIGPGVGDCVAGTLLTESQGELTMEERTNSLGIEREETRYG